MIVTTRHLSTPRLSGLAILAALLLSVTLLPPSVPARGEESEASLDDDIQSLIMNAWDQRMARQYQMGLEMPVPEVAARFAILGRWSEAIVGGTFGADKKLPEGFEKQYAEMAALVDAARSDPATDLDPVLEFIEKIVPEMEKASGREPFNPFGQSN